MVSNSVLHFFQLVSVELAEEPWLSPILSGSMDKSVLVLDTGVTCTMQGQSENETFKELLKGISREERGCTNLYEAAVIHQIVKQLLKVN